MDFGIVYGGGFDAGDELRNDMLGSHIRAVNVMRTEDQHALKVRATVVQRDYLADQFSRSVGVTRVERTGMTSGTVSSVGTIRG